MKAAVPCLRPLNDKSIMKVSSVVTNIYYLLFLLQVIYSFLVFLHFQVNLRAVHYSAQTLLSLQATPPHIIEFIDLLSHL